MRYVSFDAFRKLIKDFPEDNDLLETVLQSNNIEYVNGIIDPSDSDQLTEADLDSLLELNLWKGNVHCAVYHAIVMKSRSMGPSNPKGIVGARTCLFVTLINGIDLKGLINLYQRTLKLKAFL